MCTFADANKKVYVMATSKDFEKLWKWYQDEVQATGKSIVTFCQENGIVYAQFEKWYKSKGRSSAKMPSIVPVEVTDGEGGGSGEILHRGYHAGENQALSGVCREAWFLV